MTLNIRLSVTAVALAASSVGATMFGMNAPRCSLCHFSFCLVFTKRVDAVCAGMNLASGLESVPFGLFYAAVPFGCKPPCDPVCDDICLQRAAGTLCSDRRDGVAVLRKHGTDPCDQVQPGFTALIAGSAGMDMPSNAFTYEGCVCEMTIPLDSLGNAAQRRVCGVLEHDTAAVDWKQHQAHGLRWIPQQGGVCRALEGISQPIMR